MNLVDIWDAIQTERAHAIAKHTFARTPANPTMSNADRLVVLAEEFGEVAHAMTYDEGSWKDLRDELIDLATMAIMSLEGIERTPLVTPEEVDRLVAESREEGRNVGYEVGLADRQTAPVAPPVDMKDARAGRHRRPPDHDLPHRAPNDWLGPPANAKAETTTEYKGDDIWPTKCPTTGAPVRVEALAGVPHRFGCCNAAYGPGLVVHGLVDSE